MKPETKVSIFLLSLLGLFGGCNGPAETTEKKASYIDQQMNKFKAKEAAKQAEQNKLEAERLKELDSMDVANTKLVDARIVGVTDGDTVTVLIGTTQHKIRLDGIDAPEMKQSFGNAAKKHLSNICFSKPVTLKPKGKDKYGRILATILVAGTNANAKMVADGFAWHYKKYSSDKELASLEVEARAAKKGLWYGWNPVAPWDYRNSKTLATKAKTTTSSSPSRVPAPTEKTRLSHWLNTSSGTRHNSSCRHYNNTKRGRMCGASEGRACKTCGG